MTIGIHVNFTSPKRGRNNFENNNYSQPDYDILTTILSALKWREHNGGIRLYTDDIGFNFYKSINLLDLWDEGVRLVTDMSKSINYDVCWAAGKIYAIKKEEKDFCLIDTDLIVWENISNYFNNNRVVCVHKENLGAELIYKDIGFYKMKIGYVFDKSWGYDEHPCNTALVYFNDIDFKNYYVEESIKFMENIDYDYFVDKEVQSDLYMVFAEQRMLALCSKIFNINIKAMFDFDFNLLKNNQKTITHVWNSKLPMRNDDKLRENFCKRCIRRIISDYPHFKSRLLSIPQLSPYFDYIRSEFK